MHSTPASLLHRLRNADDLASWERFVDLYTPLLYHWAKKSGRADADAADLVQDVFLILWKKLPEFDYDPARSFHAWLKTVFLNRMRTGRRKALPTNTVEGLPEPVAPAAEDFAEEEAVQYLVRRAYEMIEREFPANYRAVFREYVLKDRPPDAVARELKISVGTVYGIKSKILHRLRRELSDLVG